MLQSERASAMVTEPPGLSSTSVPSGLLMWVEIPGEEVEKNLTFLISLSFLGDVYLDKGFDEQIGWGPSRMVLRPRTLERAGVGLKSSPVSMQVQRVPFSP